MNIFGKDIILRAISMKDTQLLLELINDPDTEKMLGGESFPVSFEGQEKWIDSQIGRADILRCIIAKKDAEEVGLGTVILSDIDRKNGIAQVHIKMDRKNGRGKGYGTDAVKAIVNYAFNEMRLNCIYAEILEYNTPSRKLFEKCGFKPEGTLRSRVYKNGEYVNVLSYSILKEDKHYEK